jgi:hypothetical protein
MALKSLHQIQLFFQSVFCEDNNFLPCETFFLTKTRPKQYF